MVTSIYFCHIANATSVEHLNTEVHLLNLSTDSRVIHFLSVLIWILSVSVWNLSFVWLETKKQGTSLDSLSQPSSHIMHDSTLQMIGAMTTTTTSNGVCSNGVCSDPYPPYRILGYCSNDCLMEFVSSVKEQPWDGTLQRQLSLLWYTTRKERCTQNQLQT